MTIIDELLILLDDLEEAPSDAIPQYFDKPDLQVIYSALGRLVSKGWVIKKERRGLTYYSISLHGIETLNQTLDAIKDTKQASWDQRWRLVIFDIPESKRKIRDSFRLLLKETGYGMLKSSVWVSPWDHSEVLRRYSKKHNIESHTFHIETVSLDSSYQLSLFVRQCWDWTVIERHYIEFTEGAQKTLTALENDREPSARFKAKKAVFRYAELVKSDPRLPETIAPHSRLARKAYDVYIKLRPYCLTEIEAVPKSH